VQRDPDQAELGTGHGGDGRPAAEVAVATGFCDQAHLTRHFRRMLATTPVADARGAGLPGRGPRPASGRQW
jgi:AraC-like DNA-binding protein